MDVNEVTLVGRMSAPAERKELPSGDTRTAWRVIVRSERDGRRARFDTIDCMTFDPKVGALVAGWRSDDVIEVVGPLRRTFFMSRHGKASSYHVEAAGVRLVERRGTPSPAVLRLPGEEAGGGPGEDAGRGVRPADRGERAAAPDAEPRAPAR